MKKFIGLVSVVLVFVAASCNDNAPEAKKEVIVVPASPVIVVKDPPPPPPPKSTTVTFDKNGVKVETKKNN